MNTWHGTRKKPSPDLIRRTSSMDKPVGWLTLAVIVAVLGGGTYLGWLWFFPTPQPESLLALAVDVAVFHSKSEDEEEQPAKNLHDPGFFASFLSDAGAPLAKRETDKSPKPRLNSSEPPGPAPEGMVWIPGGEFYMGTNSRNPLLRDAGPSHLVYVDGFWMGKHEVTNEEFARFVSDTGYVTTVEKPPPKLEGVDVSKVDKRLLTEPWSAVFTPPEKPVTDWENAMQWWKPTLGACWKHPEGPGSSIRGREKHPVVHVSWDDAVAYCKWKSKKTGKKHRLPTEAEWEFAARGGLDRMPFVWGEEKDPGGKPACNYWQGEFPNRNDKTDGFVGAAPVGSFPPNAYGLHDIVGNAWEWVSDIYKHDYYRRSPFKNPQGPVHNEDPDEPLVPFRVTRGGSFLCSENYCQKFIPAARHRSEQTAGWNHTGFRCVMDAR